MVLAVEDIHKGFGGLRAIAGVSFELHRGQILGLIGPNGAGKTTIFNVISGIYRADHGRVRLNGQDITNFRAYEIARLGLARTFQVPRTFNNMTVEQNLLVPAVRLKLSAADSIHRVHDILDRVQLLSKRHRPASELSGGERQLLQFARAVMSSPTVLILDEPFAGAGPGIIQLMIEQIKSLGDSGMGCLVISHDIVSLPRLCSDVIVLAEGAVLTSGALAEVRENPKVIEVYLGSA